MKQVKEPCAYCGTPVPLWLRFGLKKLPEGTRIICAPCRKRRGAASAGMTFPHDEDGWVKQTVVSKGREMTPYEQVMVKVTAEAIGVMQRDGALAAAQMLEEAQARAALRATLEEEDGEDIHV